jgi:hypothetical protein
MQTSQLSRIRRESHAIRFTLNHATFSKSHAYSSFIVFFQYNIVFLNHIINHKTDRESNTVYNRVLLFLHIRPDIFPAIWIQNSTHM